MFENSNKCYWSRFSGRRGNDLSPHDRGPGSCCLRSLIPLVQNGGDDMEIAEQISESLQQGDDDRVRELTRRAIEEKVPPAEILHNGLIRGMSVVGEEFRLREIFLPDVLMAARAMNAGMELLKPLLIQEGIPVLGKVVLGSVRGDLHDIGKNLVGIMLKGAGFEVIDLGTDVHPQQFVDAATAENAVIIGMSALLTTTMPVMKEVVDLIKLRGLQARIKTIVGGASVSAEFASQIGADGYAFDAAKAVQQVKELIG
jgi:5-methyltetrahydrofolate--homocysteine methyltransferase